MVGVQTQIGEQDRGLLSQTPEGRGAEEDGIDQIIQPRRPPVTQGVEETVGHSLSRGRVG